MNGIIWLVGAVVIVLFIGGFLGFRWPSPLGPARAGPAPNPAKF